MPVVWCGVLWCGWRALEEAALGRWALAIFPVHVFAGAAAASLALHSLLERCTHAERCRLRSVRGVEQLILPTVGRCRQYEPVVIRCSDNMERLPFLLHHCPPNCGNNTGRPGEKGRPCVVCMRVHACARVCGVTEAGRRR